MFYQIINTLLMKVVHLKNNIPCYIMLYNIYEIKMSNLVIKFFHIIFHYYDVHYEHEHF